MPENTSRNVLVYRNDEIGVVLSLTDTLVIFKYDHNGCKIEIEITRDDFVDIIKSFEGVLINRLTRDQLQLISKSDELNSFLRDNKDTINLIVREKSNFAIEFTECDDTGTSENEFLCKNGSEDENAFIENIIKGLATYWIINNS
jgi:hypothetical protein